MTTLETIETRIQAVTDNTTPDQLNTLKAELTASCLAPEKLQSLRAIIEAKNTLKEETKTKLRDLLTDCKPSVETAEVKSSLTQVFEGTKSPAFAPENIQKISLLIDEIFKDVKLDPKQRENIRLAMTERLLHDPEILKLADVSTGLVNRIFTHVMSGSEESTE